MSSELPELERGEVPPELLERIDNTFGKSQIEETYGPMDSLLGTIFWRRKWLVELQSPLYEVQIDESGVESNDSRTDLCGKAKTNSKAQGSCTTFPTFVVSNISPTCDDGDVPVLVVGIKPEDMATTFAITASSKYLVKLGGSVRGFLVVGNMVKEVQPWKSGQIVEAEDMQTGSMKITSEEFLNCLRDAASG